MKRVSFEVAKTIKEAGYPREWFETEYYYTVSGELKRVDDYEGNNNEDIMFYQRLAIPAPTYFDVWVWLWREKCRIEIAIDKSTDKAYTIINNHADLIFDSEENPEEAIIAAIEYLVDNQLLK